MDTLDKFLNIQNVSELSSLIGNSSIGQEGISEINFIFNSIEKLGLKNSNIKFDISLARG